MDSIVVVTSWWSNCLALTALHALVRFAPERKLLVIQAGKSERQMQAFREHLPAGVEELGYSEELLADDAPMREYLVREPLAESEGAWFFDHDTFLEAPSSWWFSALDQAFARTSECLCTRAPEAGCGVTQPAYWISPRRLPRNLPSFNPVPFSPQPVARRPDLHRHDGALTQPGKDTLVQVREELEARGMAATLVLRPDPATRLPPLPAHTHLGGLHVYSGPLERHPQTPPEYDHWRRHVVERFEAFYASCRPEWKAIEEPELVKRHRALMALLHPAWPSARDRD